MEGGDHEVVLHVYDLSFGLTRHLSRDLLGASVEGIWHTGVNVFGYEYFFGHSIQRQTPQEFEQMFGRPPTKVLVVGRTRKTKEDFEQWLHTPETSTQFSAQNYHLINNNCNDFSRLCITFLMGESFQLPEDVNEALNNAHTLYSSPNLLAARDTFEQISTLGMNFFNRLNAGQRRNQNGGQNGNQGAEAAMSSLLDFLQGLQTANQLQNRQNQDIPTRIENQLPANNPRRNFNPRAEARNAGNNLNNEFQQMFGAFSNLLSGITPVLDSLAQATQNRTQGAQNARNRGNLNPLRDLLNRPNRNQRNNVNPVRQNDQVQTEAENESETERKDLKVKLRDDVKDFVDNAFGEDDEEIVRKKVCDVLEKEGYYKMELLRGVTEEEFVQMGMKKGWAKELARTLNDYFA